MIDISVPLYLETSLISLVLHELAHVAAARALGVCVKKVGLSWKGPYIVREAGSPMQSMMIALAGPAMNLMIAACLWPWVPRFAFVNLVLGVGNMMPLPSSDGTRALKCYLDWKVRCI